jgi:hypothetical protein
MNEALIRWPWVVVATLAVAPVLAQTPQPVWMLTIPGPAAVALPQDAQAPGAASIVEAAPETREGG